MDMLLSHKGSFVSQVSHFEEVLSGIRTGRATPALVENVMISVYGGMTRLKELASISASDPKTLMLSPWDQGVLHDIVKGIVSANLGFSGVVAERAVRISIPPLTEDGRKQLAKTVQEKLHETLEGLRRLRDTIREEIIAHLRDKKITEDEKYRLQESLDALTREYQDRCTAMKDKKVGEIMTI